jgi:hypothetical protein
MKSVERFVVVKGRGVNRHYLTKRGGLEGLRGWHCNIADDLVEWFDERIDAERARQTYGGRVRRVQVVARESRTAKAF